MNPFQWTYIPPLNNFKELPDFDKTALFYALLTVTKQHPVFNRPDNWAYNQYYNLYIGYSGNTACCGAITVYGHCLHESYLEALVFNKIASVINMKIAAMKNVVNKENYASYNYKTYEKALTDLNAKYKGIIEVVSTPLVTANRGLEECLTVDVLNAEAYKKISKELLG